MIAASISVIALCLSQPATSTPPAAKPATAEPAPVSLDWKSLEAPRLTDQVQLTLPKEFIRAGEAYFDHATPPRWIVFQAQYRPDPNRTVNSPHFNIYIAKLKYDSKDASMIVGMEPPIFISREGSSNTCAWFPPPALGEEFAGVLLYASTYRDPEGLEGEGASGYSRDRGKYSWPFPTNMAVYTNNILPLWADVTGKPQSSAPGRYLKFLPEKLFEAPKVGGASGQAGYMAECSWSSDGRHVLYTYVDPVSKDPDIFVYDLTLKEHVAIVQAAGYDGGPFFSPDGNWICYRSDRKGDNNLQLYVAKLKKDDAKDPSRITGIEREIQLTDHESVVNWAPFWHPSGKQLVYASSKVSHRNYEIFSIDFDPAKDAEKKPGDFITRRVTHADGFDGLPAFSADGKHLIFTSQRGPNSENDPRPTSQVWVARWHAEAQDPRPGMSAGPAEAASQEGGAKK
jgi:TolB protein